MDLKNLDVSLTLTPKNNQGLADIANFLSGSCSEDVDTIVVNEEALPDVPDTPSSLVIKDENAPINDRTDTIYSPSGIPWDVRIHSPKKSTVNSGEWRLLTGTKKPDVDTIKHIEGELIAIHAQDQAESLIPDVPTKEAHASAALVAQVVTTAPVDKKTLSIAVSSSAPTAPTAPTAPKAPTEQKAPSAPTKNPILINIIDKLGVFIADGIKPDLIKAEQFSIDTSGDVLQTVNSFLSAYDVKNAADLENYDEAKWAEILGGLEILWSTPK